MRTVGSGPGSDGVQRNGGLARFLDVYRRNSYTPGVRHRLLRIRSFITALAWIAFAGTILTHYFDLPAHQWFSYAFEILIVCWLAVWTALNAHRLRPPGGWSNI